MGYWKKIQVHKEDHFNGRLYQEEKSCIPKHAENKLLNKRSELISKCRHNLFYSILNCERENCFRLKNHMY